MTENTLTGLPDYERPPAIETLLGFYFEPLRGWRTPNFGLFWNEIRADYPDVDVQPTVSANQEVKLELKSDISRIQISGDIPVRWLYFNKSGKTLLQVQPEIFLQNWRKRDASDPYLHYDELLPSFMQMWLVFNKFLEGNGVEKPVIRECEVSYINHIDRGQGWQSLSDLGGVVTAWSGKTSTGFLPSPGLVSLVTVYPMRGHQGQLQVSLQPGIRTSGQETLQLALSARAKPKTQSMSDLRDTLNSAREWVVRGFDDITTDHMHEIWNRKPRGGDDQ